MLCEWNLIHAFFFVSKHFLLQTIFQQFMLSENDVDKIGHFKKVPSINDTYAQGYHAAFF